MTSLEQKRLKEAMQSTEKNGFDLEKLGRKLQAVLDSETPESLDKWLNKIAAKEGDTQKKPKKKNGEPFEAGDRIWIIDLKGVREVVVHKIRNDETYYKLIIDIGIHNYEKFTIDGRHSVDKPVVLFHQEPILTFK